MAARADLAWPLYFAKRPLTAKRITLKKGEPFPIQDKGYIRGLAAAFGVPNADRVRFSELDYVEMVDVQSLEKGRHILERGLTAEQARKVMTGGADGR